MYFFRKTVIFLKDTKKGRISPLFITPVLVPVSSRSLRISTIRTLPFRSIDKSSLKTALLPIIRRNLLETSSLNCLCLICVLLRRLCLICTLPRLRWCLICALLWLRRRLICALLRLRRRLICALLRLRRCLICTLLRRLCLICTLLRLGHRLVRSLLLGYILVSVLLRCGSVLLLTEDLLNSKFIVTGRLFLPVLICPFTGYIMDFPLHFDLTSAQEPAICQSFLDELGNLAPSNCPEKVVCITADFLHSEAKTGIFFSLLCGSNNNILSQVSCKITRVHIFPPFAGVS